MKRTVILQFVFAFAACGSGGSIPDIFDASMPSDSDMCQCQSAVPLLADLIERKPDTINTNGGLGLGWGCTEGLLIGMGCSITALNSTLVLAEAGIEPRVTGPDASKCDWNWYNPQLESADLTNTAVCLQAATYVPPSGGSDGCDCPSVESLAERVYRVQKSQGLPAGSAGTVSASCPDAAVIGGGCSMDPNISSLDALDFFLTQSGVSDGTWTCSANNARQESYTLTATAVCIRPPAPGTAPEDEPVADRVLYVTQEESLLTNSVSAFSAACAPGDYLISGGCTLDTTDPRSQEIALFSNGFEAGDTNTNAWRCAWNNPTDATPTARATAICLAPLTL